MTSRRAPWWVYALLPALYLFHNDLWLWDDPSLVVGLPVGLLYHIGFCLAASGMLYLLVTRAWPSHLDSTEEETA